MDKSQNDESSEDAEILTTKQPANMKGVAH